MQTDTITDTIPIVATNALAIGLTGAMMDAACAALVKRGLHRRTKPGEGTIPVEGFEPGFDFFAVNRAELAQEAPELVAWADHPSTAAKFSRIVGTTVVVGRTKYGIAVNAMIGKGKALEWHFDVDPWTAVVFLYDVEPDDGGSFVFLLPEDDRDYTKPRTVAPRRGLCLVMDGSKIAHAVNHLKADRIRASLIIGLHTPEEADIDDTYDGEAYE